MYEIKPIVTNLGDGELLRLIAKVDGLSTADQCAYHESALAEDLQLRDYIESQVRFINRIGKDPNRDEVVGQLVKEPSSVVAEPMGLTVLAAFALTFGGVGQTGSYLLKPLMGLNFETLRRPGTDEIRFASDSMSSAIASFSLNAERYLNVRWRFHELISLSRTAEARAHAQYVNLDAEIEAIFGTSYDSLIAASWVIDCLLDPEEIRRRGEAAIRYRELNGLDNEGKVRRFLDQFTIQVDDLREIVRTSPLDRLRETLYMQLLRTPVIALDADRFLIPSTRFFENTVSLGWFYALLEARRSISPRESQRLLNFFGALFEQYIVSIVLRIARNTGAKAWGEETIGSVKTSDAMLKRGGDLILIEVASSRLSAGILGDPADAALLEKDLERTLFEKTDQVADNVNHVLRGELTDRDLSPNDVTRIYPLVAQYRSFLRTEGLQEQLQRRFVERLANDDARIRPIEIVDAELLEGLEEHLRDSVHLAQLIEEKVTPGSQYISATFKNFVCHRHPEFPLRMSESASAAERDWAMKLKRIVESWCG